MNDSVDDNMPDEHERINEIRNQRKAGEPSPHSAVFPNNEPAIGSPTLKKQVENSKKVLVCDECAEWYDYSEDWASCPKCEAELTEVDKA